MRLLHAPFLLSCLAVLLTGCASSSSTVTVGGKSVMAAGELDGNELYADIDGHRQRVVVVPGDNQFTLFGPRGAMQFALARPDYGDEGALADAAAFTAPMPGVVVKLLVEPGQRVERDQPLLVLEAMKMEQPVLAPANGQIEKIAVNEGESVSAGQILCRLVQQSEDLP